jgi:cytochrome b pre-mRNA-processing protein 3
MLKHLFRPNHIRTIGRSLHASIVAAARDPSMFGDGLVPDTLDGRFDLVVLHAALVHIRLAGRGEQAERTSQALFDATFDAFDDALREIGVGDLTVAKRIKDMAKAFYGRSTAYRRALEARDDAALGDALTRNLFARSEPGPSAVGDFAEYAFAAFDGLAAISDKDILNGQIVWPQFRISKVSADVHETGIKV